MANRQGALATQWKPGQSGNPGGRPKSIGPIVRANTNDGEELVRLLLELARNGQSETARISAITTLLAYGHGKPAEYAPIQGENPLGLDLSDAADKFRADVLRLAPRAQAAAADPQVGQARPG